MTEQQKPERFGNPDHEVPAPSLSPGGAERRVVKLGVIEFHSERVNPGLMKRFYAVTEDLRAAGCIVDLWLMDIATVLREFGYEMTVTTDKPAPRIEVERV